MRKFLLVALVLLLGSICGFVGYHAGPPLEPQAETEYQVITEYIDIERPVEVYVDKEVLVYVDRVEQVEVEKEVIRWRNKPYRPWYSVEEFKEWYQDQHYEASIILGDCNDYALRLQKDALQDGHPVSIALAFSGHYYRTKVTDAPNGHAGNLILIHEKGGDVYYFVEPQPTSFKVTRIVTNRG